MKFAISLYLERYIIEGLQEVVRVTAENGFVEVEAVRPAIDFTI